MGVVASGPVAAGCSLNARQASGWQAIPSVIVPVDAGVFTFDADGDPHPIVEVWAKGTVGWRRVWVRNLAPGNLAAPTLAAAWNDGAEAWVVTASWAAAAAADVDGYEVEWSSPAAVVDPAAGLSLSREFPPATTVSVRVRAKDWYGAPGPWSPAAQIATNVGPPPPPVNAYEGATSGFMVVEWNMPVGGTLSPTFDIQWQIGAGAWETMPYASTGTARRVTGVVPESGDWTVRVRETLPGTTTPGPWSVSDPVPMRPPPPIVGVTAPPDLTLLVTVGSRLRAGYASAVYQTKVGAGAWSADVPVTADGVAQATAPFPFGSVVTIRAKTTATNGRVSDWQEAPATAVQGLVAPAAPTVVASTFGTVTLSVPAVVGAEQYRVEVLNSSGTALFSTVGVNPASLAVGGLSLDTRYQFRVRAERTSAGGAQGPYGPATRYAIGHPSQTCQRTEERSRPWSSGPVAVSLKRDQIGGANVPSRVATHTITVHVACRNAAGALTSSTMTSASRQLNWVIASAVGFSTGAKPSPWDEATGWAQNTPGIAGLRPTGSGWSLSGSDYMVVGTIQVDGTEYYDVVVNYECVAQVPNGPW